MSSGRVRITVLALAALGLTCLSFGCSSPGYAKAESKVASLRELRAEIAQGNKQLDSTLAALGEVVATGSTDPRPAYDKFVGELNSLTSQRENIRSRADAMRARSDEYFQSWQKDLQGIQSAEVRQVSEEQRVKAKERFKKLQDLSAEARDKLDPLMANLQDIKMLLANSLNQAGIAAAGGLVTKAKEGGAAASQSIDALLAELDSVIGAVSAKVEVPQAAAPKSAPAPEASKP